MPSWCYFGYGIEIKEQDARKIGLAIAKDENLLYENDTFEFRQFHGHFRGRLRRCIRLPCASN